MAPKSCFFCHRNINNVEMMFESGSHALCNFCIDQCYESIHASDEPEHHFSIDETNNDDDIDLSNLITPMELKQQLDLHIVGQEEAKICMSVAVYNHYKRLKHTSEVLDDQLDNVEIAKSNILMLGPTGSGKTLIAKTLAKILDVPFAIADATTLTQAGYVGDDVENVLLGLYHAANKNIRKAEKGIVFIDEIDKLRKASSGASISRDVSGEGVQQALLKIIEGANVSIPEHGGRKHPEGPVVTINTSNILFIAGGSFAHLDKVILKRIGNSRMGFEKHDPEKDVKKIKDGFLGDVQTEDLIVYGMIPEFIGRFPCIVACHPITAKDMLKIITEPKDAILKQYKKLFLMDNIMLEFSLEAKKLIAAYAMQLKTGARGLRQIIETILLDHMYIAPSNKPSKILIDSRCVEKACKHRYNLK